MIRLDHISYCYAPGEAPALQDVSLHIREGEFLAVAGHNGSGKSTLAKHLNALLLPTSGDVLVSGMNTKDEANTLAIRQTVGMVFQNPDNQIVTTVVEEDVGFGPENLGVPTEEIITRVREALSDVEMTEMARSAPHMLSGGQKQRVAIAGMLAMRPRVIVLDEATAMLDPKGRRDVLRIIRELNRSRGMTVVMITQYMEEAVMADRVAVMARGEIIALDTPQKVFAQTALLKENRLDVPEIAALRDALNAEGWGIPDACITIDAMLEALCPLL
ncbi:MAG: energy-coupling factor transporter ATPase [Eubacteriales bacterium]|nr:energy-coupling factor transporter ATPase [Eubacteriales bacterium]